MEQPIEKQNEFTSEQEFRDSVALQFDLLKQMQPILEEPDDTTNAYMKKAMDDVLTIYRKRLESGESNQEHYNYVVNFWLDNVNTRNNPLTPID